MERKECPYDKGRAYISTNSIRGQENCERVNCSERGDFYSCYYENCRVIEEEVTRG